MSSRSVASTRKILEKNRLGTADKKKKSTEIKVPKMPVNDVFAYTISPVRKQSRMSKMKLLDLSSEEDESKPAMQNSAVKKLTKPTKNKSDIAPLHFIGSPQKPVTRKVIEPVVKKRKVLALDSDHSGSSSSCNSSLKPKKRNSKIDLDDDFLLPTSSQMITSTKAVQCEKCKKELLQLSRSGYLTRLHKRATTTDLQSAFCIIHKEFSSVILNADKKRYPIKIDFDDLKRRVGRMKADLAGIISGEQASHYRELGLARYETMGARKAASTLGKMDHALELRCGYYGDKGMKVISAALMDLFRYTNIDSIKPMKKYVQDVLVPEACCLLIKDDIQLPNIERARSLMNESVRYGEFVNDALSSEEED